MKAYRIERIKGGMKFNCTHCSHSVSTLDFDAKAGNLRTQAATAINDHAAKAHHEPLVVSPSDGSRADGASFHPTPLCAKNSSSHVRPHAAQ